MKDENIAAILSYFLVGVLWYFLDEKMRKNQYVRFHVQQALGVFIFAILWHIALAIVFFPLAFLGKAFIGFSIIFGLAKFVLELVPLVLWIYGILFAIKEEDRLIPVIGRFARGLKI